MAYLAIAGITTMHRKMVIYPGMAILPFVIEHTSPDAKVLRLSTNQLRMDAGLWLCLGAVMVIVPTLLRRVEKQRPTEQPEAA
jgi:hypothetical protein